MVRSAKEVGRPETPSHHDTRRADKSIVPRGSDRIPELSRHARSWTLEGLKQGAGAAVKQIGRSCIGQSRVIQGCADQDTAAQSRDRTAELVGAVRTRILEGLKQNTGRTVEQMDRSDIGCPLVAVEYPNDNIIARYRDRVAELVSSLRTRVLERLQQSAGRTVKQIHHAGVRHAHIVLVRYAHDHVTSQSRHRIAEPIILGRGWVLERSEESTGGTVEQVSRSGVVRPHVVSLCTYDHVAAQCHDRVAELVHRGRSRVLEVPYENTGGGIEQVGDSGTAVVVRRTDENVVAHRGHGIAEPIVHEERRVRKGLKETSGLRRTLHRIGKQ